MSGIAKSVAASWPLTVWTRTFEIQREAENLEILIFAMNSKFNKTIPPALSKALSAQGGSRARGCGWGCRALSTGTGIRSVPERIELGDG